MNFGIYALILLASFAAPLRAETISVAVASNFNTAMGAIAEAFEKESGHTVLRSSAASGKLYAQINHGAPFHVFFSADQTKPAALEKQALAVNGTRFTYALGTLVLWSRQEKLIDEHASVLRSLEFHHLALANPKLAPFGAAALDVLDNLGIVEKTRQRWVQGENIAQTFQFIMSGSAELGFVSRSQIMQPDGSGASTLFMGSAWQVPADLYQPIRQDAVLLRQGENSPAARALLAFVRSDQGRSIIARYGYELPVSSGSGDTPSIDAARTPQTRTARAK